MSQKAVKAIVATVKYAGFEFQGLKLPSGEYRIAISQVVELFQRSNKGFQFLKKNAQRDIKTLLGNGFQFLKIASEINPKKVNTLTLEKNPTSSNYQKFIYSNCSDEVNRIVFGRTAKKLKENWNCIDVRSAFTTEELLIGQLPDAHLLGDRARAC